MKISAQKGFSLVEIIIAVAIFAMIAVSGIATIVHSFTLNKLGEEESSAHFFAQEGLEAVKSIKNQNWGSLTDGPHGLQTTGNVWSFSGINNSQGKFTRQVVVTPAQRDVGGNLVDTGGTVDPDTKKVTSTVDWNFSNGRTGNNITLVTYFTNFRKAISSLGNGIIIYGDGTTIPKFKIYDSAANSFSTASNSIIGASGQFFSMRTSPVKREAIAGYVTSTGNLQIICFDGTSWTNEWSISVGGTATTRRFDIGYETQSGDVIVVYSRNSASANSLAYRTKPGSSGCGSANWGSAINFGTTPVATTGTVHWVRLARDPRSGSNILTAIWADSNADLGANNWSGTAWATGTGTFKALETDLERISTPQDVDSFEVVYESLTGNAMVVWGTAAGANGTNGARYSRCTGGVYTCSWATTSSVPTVSEDVHNIDMSANPNTNQISFAAIGNAGDDLIAGYWSGSAWTGYANLDTTTESPFVGSRLVSTSWLVNGGTTRWILNYDDNTGTGLGWYSANPGSAPVKQTDFNATPAINDIRERYDADMDPTNKNQAMVTLSDSTRSIFAKRASMDTSGNITWTNADGGASLGSIPVVPPQGFSFFYWRY